MSRYSIFIELEFIKFKMNDEDWEKALERAGGKPGIIRDLAAQFSGRAPEMDFALNWFNSKDTDSTFRDRVKKLLGEDLFNIITEPRIKRVSKEG